MALKTFDAKQTTWEGLWYHPENGGFSSSALDLSKLKGFKGKVRLYVRKNRFYNGGENGRPNYTFCLKDAESETFRTIDVVDDDGLYTKIARLKEVMSEGEFNADRMMLPSESMANAKALYEEAVSIIEDITGGKWEFSYIQI